ncbi:MAG: hypothetical protein MUC69_09950 [Gemmatimonadales bacterium]|jgi:hypothetical protein|nr:hypothetical protein [Gemmatimonadales bacterium]
MALRNTHPLEPAETKPLKVAFNWVTATGANILRTIPLGGAAGVVAAGIVLWFAPRLVPAGWSAEAVLSLGMGTGVVVHRLLELLLGWFLDPVRFHVGARWDAALRLRKVERYRRRGLLPDDEAQALVSRIVKDDVTAKRPARRGGAG